MNNKINKLTPSALRLLLIQETKKFITALDYGSTPSDLEEIRDHIREIVYLLKEKEDETIKPVNVGL